MPSPTLTVRELIELLREMGLLKPVEDRRKEPREQAEKELTPKQGGGKV